MRGWVWMVVVAGSAGWMPRAEARARITDRRVAEDGVTKGWMVEYPSPDKGQSDVAGTLVIARRGRVIRRIEGDSTFWGWVFWNGGRSVAYETGPLHGATMCVLRDVRSGQVVEKMLGDCQDATEEAPAWVRAVKAR